MNETLRAAAESLPIVPQAWRYAVPLIAVGVVLVPFTLGASLAAVLAGLGVIWFFRDPDRDPPDDGVVAPADGRVSVIREQDDGRLRVGVFMTPFHVHVNRVPADGIVRDCSHRPGANKFAFSKDSDRNEKLHIECDDYAVELIAGTFIRRITPYVEESEQIERGQRVGHISFGSRADVVLPPEVSRDDLTVEKWDAVRAGETVVAQADDGGKE